MAEGARGASSRMELPEGRRAPNHVNYRVWGFLMAPLHTFLRPLESARLLQNMRQIIIFIILAIILVALKAYLKGMLPSSRDDEMILVQIIPDRDDCGSGRDDFGARRTVPDTVRVRMMPPEAPRCRMRSNFHCFCARRSSSLLSERSLIRSPPEARLCVFP